ncbi:MAG: hypothetical protein QXP84_07485 [Candidatus Korarchaeum sp.]
MISTLTIADLRNILDSVANPINIDEIRLSQDLREAVKESKIWAARIASAVPMKGFDIAFIREKTPREEIENVVSHVERMGKEIHNDVADFLEYVSRIEMLMNATTIGEGPIRVELEMRLISLAIKCNSVINELRRLIAVFIIHSSFKLSESLSAPAFPR